MSNPETGKRSAGFGNTAERRLNRVSASSFGLGLACNQIHEEPVGPVFTDAGAQGIALRVTATRQTSGPFSRYSKANASSPRVASSV